MSEDPIHVEISEQDSPPDVPPAPPKLEPPIAITVSIAEQQHQDEIRARSIELAYLRGHLRRN